MTNGTSNIWPYPGSRWWKFDFHTHTPASSDYGKGANQEALKNISPEEWLLKFMEAEVDCVAVTDHNSGEWVDDLKGTLNSMEQNEHPDYRPLHLFPGVEITCHDGTHVLAIFDCSEGKSEVISLLGAVGYKGDYGASNVTADLPTIKVIRKVHELGGIAIPAHVDSPSGLWKSKGNSLASILEDEDLLAVEIADSGSTPPEIYRQKKLQWSQVLGSDSHHPDGTAGPKYPGSHFTWVKMSKPTLEGLRLALLDGKGISIKRSDEGDFDPFQTPKNFIERIQIKSAQFMGNGSPEILKLSPWYNALIGGRGTGKSTIVHALRLGYRRDDELEPLGEMSAPYQQFKNFVEPARGRYGRGALREETEIALGLQMEGAINALRWRSDGKGDVVWEQDDEGGWRASDSQFITAERFPVRILSQGQIAAIAEGGRQALLNIIDDAASVGDLHQRLRESTQTYFTQRARLREMYGRMAEEPELKRRLAELKRKLSALENSQHTTVLKGHQRALRQEREIDLTLDQLQSAPGYIRSATENLLLDDWSGDIFDPETDKDMISWKGGADKLILDAKQAIEKIAQELEKKVEAHVGDERLKQWRQRSADAKQAYEKLQEKLAEEGVDEPEAFGQMAHQRQLLEGQLKEIEQLKKDYERLKGENEGQWLQILHDRKEITQARQQFVQTTLHENNFVRMEIVQFGFDEINIKASFRKMIEDYDHFESDILDTKDGIPQGGLAHEIASADDKQSVLTDIKSRLIDIDEGLGGHFRNYLERRLEKPEFEDHIQCWFPDDDIRVEYSRPGKDQDWTDIHQGSQGQRSAALLAFLLAFGDEPLILDQPEDDLDNHLIYELIVRQIRENKLRRQLIIVTHNPNVVVNGDAEMVHAFDFQNGQCQVVNKGSLQEKDLREEVCKIMEGGREAFSRRWARLGKEI